jgi:hypothetical protein
MASRENPGLNFLVAKPWLERRWRDPVFLSASVGQPISGYMPRCSNVNAYCYQKLACISTFGLLACALLLLLPSTDAKSVAPMFTIKDTRDKGQGWFATCDIPAETQIFDEDYLFRLPMDADAASLDAKLNALPVHARKIFDSLPGTDDEMKFWNHCSPLQAADDRQGVKPRKEVGLYLQCCKINHACRPNSARSLQDGKVTVVAQKSIKKGEEIAVSYVVDNFQTAKRRMAEIDSKHPDIVWANGCRCDLCAGPEEDLRESDQRRLQLAALRKLLVEKGDNQAAARMVDLMGKEGLFHALMGVDALLAIMRTCSPETFDEGNVNLGGDVGGGDDDESAEDEDRDVQRLLTQEQQAYARAFRIGRQVVVRNLVGRPELNGQKATVVHAYDVHSGRVGVRMDSLSLSSSPDPIAVKVDNLTLL